MNCANCGQRVYLGMTDAGLAQIGGARLSKRAGYDDLCVRCAWPDSTPVRSFALTRRYCTCPGYYRTVGLPIQCAHCRRRIHPRYDASIGADPEHEEG